MSVFFKFRRALSSCNHIEILPFPLLPTNYEKKEKSSKIIELKIKTSERKILTKKTKNKN